MNAYTALFLGLTCLVCENATSSQDCVNIGIAQSCSGSAVSIFYYFFFLFYLYIYPPDSQESDGGANT